MSGVAYKTVRSDCYRASVKRLTRFLYVVFRRRRLRPQHAVIALCAILIIAYGASTVLSLRHAYRQAFRDAGATLTGTARSAETGTSQSLFEIDATLLGVDRMLAAVLSRAQWDDPSVTRLLRQFDEQKLAISELLILDAQGREVNRSRSGIDGARNYTGDAFFAAHQSGGAPKLFIGSPEHTAANDDWVIMVSRPLTRNNLLSGVIAAVVPVATFGDFFAATVTGGAAQISLMLDKGVLLASEPGGKQRIGRVPKSAPALLAAAAKEAAGLLEIPADEEGNGGYSAFARWADIP